MVNSEQFAQRLQKIMEFYDISAAAFAEAIEVGRSSISHILSGRNKPSLDFVLKVVQTYPEVELYWLLNGRGSFPSSTPNTKNTGSSASTDDLKSNSEPATPQTKMKEGGMPSRYNVEKKIIKIVVLYEDGTFDAFENGNLV